MKQIHLDLPTALVLSRTLDLRPRRRPYVVPSVPFRVPDWLLVLSVFPTMLGVYMGLLAVLMVLGWRT